MKKIIRDGMHVLHTVGAVGKGTDKHYNNNTRRGVIHARTTLPAAEQASQQCHLSVNKKIATIRAREDQLKHITKLEHLSPQHAYVLKELQRYKKDNRKQTQK